MALDPSELAKLLKLRAVGWSQQEIADAIGTSQQVVAYHLKKLKEESLKRDPEEVFEITNTRHFTGRESRSHSNADVLTAI